MKYHLRHIRDRDWDGIARLEVAAYAEAGLSEGRAALESIGYASPATSFVIDTGEQLAGYLLALPYPRFRFPDLGRAEQYVFDSPDLHLHDLVIGDGFRGNGLATRLVHHLVETARSRMFERISLIAVAGSHTFWSANGYHAHPGVIPPSSYGANAMYMSTAVDRC